MDILNNEMIPPPYSITKISPKLIFETNNGLRLDNTGEEIGDLLNNLQMKGMFRNLIIFITHGFENTIETAWMVKMKTEILKHNDALVVRVGWGGGADVNPLEYPQAVANTQEVGKWLSRILIATRGPNPDAHIWGIGHSLGAHVMGRAGRESRVLNRITGLDPAGPSFESVMKDKALCSTDAEIVDVIHTDGFDPSLAGRIIDPKPKVGDEQMYAFMYTIHSQESQDTPQNEPNTTEKPDNFVNVSDITPDNFGKGVPSDGPTVNFYDLTNLVNHYGTLKPCGTIDFYPNWGYLQPGTFLEDVTDVYGSLSHSRAYDFFIWSIGNPGKMVTNLALDGIPDVGKPVHEKIVTEITVEMGFHYRKVNTKNNLYVLSTNDRIPWK